MREILDESVYSFDRKETSRGMAHHDPHKRAQLMDEFVRAAMNKHYHIVGGLRIQPPVHQGQ